MAVASSSARRKALMNSGTRMGIRALAFWMRFAALKVRAPGLLGGHDLVRLLDQGGDEPQGDGHHHGQLMDRHMDLFHPAQQPLQPVGEADGAGGVGHQERAHDQAA